MGSFADAQDDSGKIGGAAIEATIAMGRVGRADRVANAIVWLLSDEASLISGVTLDASGGGFVFGKR
ncbi:SDR family oxidoreductase [Reyranella sp.]|uniref:SDR family oxidoreductase n=1 Tax=Reyranella sp. TaxID=1929291 RepID=UPI003BA86CFA